MKTKILYCRVSSIDQKTDRQRVDEKSYGRVIEDKCSGAVPFFEREGGKEVSTLIKKGVDFSLSVLTIDRLGRDLRDILNTIHFFNEKKITVHFVSQGLSTLDMDGKENAITKMMISILGTVGEMERTQIKERQRAGIDIAKMKGIYTGRVEGSKEDAQTFLSKDKNKKALDLLDKGYKSIEIAKLLDLNINTITKIKKLSKAA